MFGCCVCAVFSLNLALKSYKTDLFMFQSVVLSQVLGTNTALMPQHSFLGWPGLCVCAHGHPWQELCALLAEAPGDDLALGPTVEEPRGRLSLGLSG